MPGHHRKSVNKDEVLILSEKKSNSSPSGAAISKRKKMEISSSSASNLSVLDDSLTKQLVSVAEIAIRDHLQQQKKDKKAAVTGKKDDEVQVLSEKTNVSKPNQTVLQLGLPKDLQFKIIEQLRASGKSAGQIDLNNLFSEVFSKTMKKMSGLEITNCSLRISSNGKRKQSSSTHSKDEPVPLKKHKPSQNDSSMTNGHKSSPKRSEINGSTNHEEPPQLVIRRPVGRPRKNQGSPATSLAPAKKPELLKILKPKKLRPQRSSSRLTNDQHTIKEWPSYPLKKKKNKMKGPHRESTKVTLLRQLPIVHRNAEHFVNVHLFNELFVDFKMSPNALMSMIVMLHGDPAKDFIFKKWQITHLSLRAAQEIIKVINKPLFLTKIWNQLNQLPIVPLTKVDPQSYNKTHLTQLSRNEFCNLFAFQPTRVSQRTKQPTQKFQDSPCITSMTTLSSSITTPPKKLSKNLNLNVEDNNEAPHRKAVKDQVLKKLGKSRLIDGKLRPKYRKLLEVNAAKIPEKNADLNGETNEIVDDFNYLADVAADENEILLLEDDSPELVDVTEMNSMLCEQMKLEETANTAAIVKPGLAVRKFPSYGWNREREARIKIEMAAPPPPAAPAKNEQNQAVKKAPNTRGKDLDFPPFQLSGLVETAPKEVEGWFTSKVSLLRQLSEPNSAPSSKSNSPNSSRSGSVQKKVKSSYKGKLPEVQVFLDQDVELITDMPEYKANLEAINNIIEEIESVNNHEPENGGSNDQILINESLRVAKKIEKISIAGIGRQVSLPSPQSYLPPGWHCRKTAQGPEYVNHDGAVKVKSIQAAIKYEASKISASTSSFELLNTTIP